MTALLEAHRKIGAPAVHFRFISDGTLAGDKAVGDMNAICEQDYQTLKTIFNASDPPGLPALIHVDANAGGAYHLSCESTEIFLIPDDAPTLLVAEMVEVFEAQTGTWDCGFTNGEGLSRALAESIRPAQVLTGLDGDVDGWWSTQHAGNPLDYVNDNSADDRNQQANACGTLFLYWLRYQLGYPWNMIVDKGGSRLGVTYTFLTGQPGAMGFAKFVDTLKPYDQGGHLQIPVSGNPFPVGTPSPTPSPPSPPPTPSPTPTPPPTKPTCPLLRVLLKFKRVRRQLYGSVK